MDFGARLNRKHLQDLIAYMKVSQICLTPKPSEEDNLDSEEAMAEYMQHCIFKGLMP